MLRRIRQLSLESTDSPDIFLLTQFMCCRPLLLLLWLIMWNRNLTLFRKLLIACVKNRRITSHLGVYGVRKYRVRLNKGEPDNRLSLSFILNVLLMWRDVVRTVNSLEWILRCNRPWLEICKGVWIFMPSFLSILARIQLGVGIWSRRHELGQMRLHLMRNWKMNELLLISNSLIDMSTVIRNIYRTLEGVFYILIIQNLVVISRCKNEWGAAFGFF